MISQGAGAAAAARWKFGVSGSSGSVSGLGGWVFGFRGLGLREGPF